MSTKARIFVIDDEQIISDTLAMVLKHAGFDAVPLYSGPDAIALCCRAPCDALLTDSHDEAYGRNSDGTCDSPDLPSLQSTPLLQAILILHTCSTMRKPLDMNFRFFQSHFTPLK